MVEKWLLVLLIVGCTSLVFFICFPIDFFLYRRRKRLARERKNKLPIYQLRNTPRAEQNHARITHHHKLSLENEEMNIARRKSDHFKTQIGIAKILSKLRKKSTTDDSLDPGYENGDLKSENSTEFQLLSTTPDCMTSTTDKAIFEESESPYNALKHVQVREVGETLNIDDMKTHSGPVNERKPNVKISNLSSALDESEELVDHENKHLNYGALEPYGTILQTIPPSASKEERCFTIPVNKGFQMLNSNIGESCTDFEVFHDERTLEKFEMTDTKSRSKSALTLFASNDEDRYAERYLDAHGPHPPPSYEIVRHSEAMMFETEDLPFRNNHRRPQSKILEHSFSDHFISYNSGPGCLKTSSRKTKKRNLISPSLKSPECDNDVETDTEDVYKHTRTTKNENFINYDNIIPGNVFKTKKKKKKVMSKRQSSESMPELTLNKEKF
ncbi:hypothetical protein ACF0H5_016662 [Mactra antiquata]